MNESHMLIYQTDDGHTKIETRLGNQTVWLNQVQIAELFQKSKSTINEHILNIYKENELEESSSMRKIGISDFSTKPTNFYNLDMIIALGYRVKSPQGIKFRQWATKILKEYMVKGFTLNDDMLKELGGGTYFDELLARIRDIRSSEKVFYRKILDIYETSIDYDAKVETSKTFFKTIQNKMHFAAHGHTAAEIVWQRADAESTHMGLTTFKGKEPNKKEIKIAKKKSLYYTEGLNQAKDYAQRLNIRYTYATNGERIYQVDMQEGEEGDATRFPTPDELWQMTFPKEDSLLEKLFAVPFETKGGTWLPRYYQENAITKTLEAIAKGQDRILLTFATGTGKTAIAFQVAWKLFHAKWNLKKDFSRSPRILFLADRNILANQAFNAFGAFKEDALVRIEPSEIRKKGKVPTNGSIFFTIFQTFMSGDDETAYLGEYPKDFFDFIMIDECHRGGANDESSWRAILDYFSPAIQLGLTATPKRNENVDTYNYFGKPVYEYSLKEGINDGFLTPFKVKEIATTGDKYVYTSDDEILEGEIEEGREYSKEEQNKIIEIMEIERYKVKLFMDMMNQSEKTLVFCETQIHAAAIRDLINQYAKSKNPNYCQRVTANDGARGETQLKYFRDNEKTIPTILTTSKKLSTGVDAPEIKHIVLLRAVKSMVEFKQIVGRGTRLFDKKDFFTIYDFVEAHQHFNDPDPSQPKEPCKTCQQRPCICEKGEDEPCSICLNRPCVCEKTKKGMIRMRLSKGKTLELDSMVKTSFYAPDGKPMSAEEFIGRLFTDLPKFFKSEAELRRIWSLPDTRKRLLEELSEHGYNKVQLDELKKLVKAKNSDIFDVLSYIAYHRDIIPRINRVAKAELRLKAYDKEKQKFLNFVLKQYVDEGVKELDDSRLKGLLELRYQSVHDAKEAIGDIASIRLTSSLF